jgi:hypothetical protein
MRVIVSKSRSIIIEKKNDRKIIRNVSKFLKRNSREIHHTRFRMIM